MQHIAYCCCSHYIVPELGPDMKFTYSFHKVVDEYKEAKAVSSLFSHVVSVVIQLTLAWFALLERYPDGFTEPPNLLFSGSAIEKFGV